MPKVKAILFDVDGVLVVPWGLFIDKYRYLYPDRNVQEEAIKEQFFLADFRQAKRGKADILPALEDLKHLWEWDGSAEDLLQIWLEADSNANVELVDYIQEVRRSGVKCYLATNQEQHRADYIREVMFPDKFDGMYVSCEMGVGKPKEEYFQMILDDLKLPPEKIMFFDDRQANIDAANDMGLQAHYCEGKDSLRVVKERVGL